MTEFISTEIITLVGAILGAIMAGLIENAMEDDPGDNRTTRKTTVHKIFWMISGGIIGLILTLGGLVLFGYLSLDTPKDTVNYDNFDDPVYDGRFNTQQWISSASSPNSIKQQNGLLLLTIEPSSPQTDIILLSKRDSSTDQSLFVESKLLLSEENKGNRGDIAVGLATTVAGDKDLFYICLIGRSSVPKIWCEVYGRLPDGAAEYTTSKTNTSYDSWHTVRIEIDPTVNVRFEIDGQQVGTYQPLDAADLRNNTYEVQLSVWSPERDGIKAFFDDVNIGLYK
jgi:hypothetical protein